MKTSMACMMVVIAALAGCGNKGDAPSAKETVAAVGPAAAAVVACGAKGQPDCPLQAWMKGNLGNRLSAGDTAALATSFKRIATFAPPGFDGWAAISAAGEKAALAGDLDGARAACKECHANHREAYREKMRSRPLPR